ncbi:hypothetical protein F9C07_6514 [Aspergillus flavus]|uniref:Uncharacterized protein n=1 Tax=Aspergillus flavus (strain ATCC 200026 / FGSC A1120 / IAM 13836 / NRRL 3357 / JCM 12722 / SRRC 167) TaxID=332952 RepID=A0A7U2MHN2_ASPFN|nr:hypothetical protein F9C07_6514 [Aspergillus flavus]
MVESPRIATVQHVALATAADALLPILSAISFPRGITDPCYSQTKDSTLSRVAFRSGAKKTPHSSFAHRPVSRLGWIFLAIGASRTLAYRGGRDLRRCRLGSDARRPRVPLGRQ